MWNPFKRKPKVVEQPQGPLVRSTLTEAETRMFWRRVDAGVSEAELLMPFQPEVREAAKEHFVYVRKSGAIYVDNEGIVRRKKE